MSPATGRADVPPSLAKSQGCSAEVSGGHGLTARAGVGVVGEPGQNLPQTEREKTTQSARMGTEGSQFILKTRRIASSLLSTRPAGGPPLLLSLFNPLSAPSDRQLSSALLLNPRPDHAFTNAPSPSSTVDPRRAGPPCAGSAVPLSLSASQTAPHALAGRSFAAEGEIRGATGLRTRTLQFRRWAALCGCCAA